MYFCCLEALQNVQKHADARTASIRLRKEAGGVNFEVTDYGRGFDLAGAHRGTGFDNMQDPLDALGGSLAVTTTPGQGVRLSGSVSLP